MNGIDDARASFHHCQKVEKKGWKPDFLWLYLLQKRMETKLSWYLDEKEDFHRVELLVVNWKWEFHSEKVEEIQVTKTRHLIKRMNSWNPDYYWNSENSHYFWYGSKSEENKSSKGKEKCQLYEVRAFLALPEIPPITDSVNEGFWKRKHTWYAMGGTLIFELWNSKIRTKTDRIHLFWMTEKTEKTVFL